jgi:hypothetical protein
MSTTPVTDPSQVTPAILGQETYEALVAGYAPQNAGLEKQAAPGQSVTISVPSLAAIQLVEAVAAAGIQPTPAMIAAQVTAVTFVPNAAAAPPPPYSLGRQIGSGMYILNASGPYPPANTEVSINGQNYFVQWYNMFNMSATLIQS